jgi:hypothetical protein
MGKQNESMLVKREALLKEYKELTERLAQVRQKMAALAGTGQFRPNAVLRLCKKCGGGPFTGRGIRTHSCPES